MNQFNNFDNNPSNITTAPQSPRALIMPRSTKESMSRVGTRTCPLIASKWLIWNSCCTKPERNMLSGSLGSMSMYRKLKRSSRSATEPEGFRSGGVVLVKKVVSCTTAAEANPCLQSHKCWYAYNGLSKHDGRKFRVLPTDTIAELIWIEEAVFLSMG